MSQHNINIDDPKTRLALVEQSNKNLEDKLDGVHTDLKGDMEAMNRAVHKRIDRIEVKVEDLGKEIQKGQNGLVKVIIGSAGTIVVGIISVIVALIQYS
jgi:hypothetical protein